MSRRNHRNTGLLTRRSHNDGVMHACGHDGHMAMLLGGARLLKEREPELQGFGTVKIVFQPAEEGGAGAAKMLSEGADARLRSFNIYRARA